MENKKKTIILSIIAIATFAILVIGATYAYFNASIGDLAAADIKINANTVDTFTFSSGNQISLNLDQESFASGKGNIIGSTYASALLTANNKTNTATEHYYLYLNISDNTFTYSINENTPEIIMTLTDSAGTEITDISTLNHVIVTGANNTQVSGYDITNKSGLITLFDNREITTTSSKEEKWNITITFVNYDASQNANAGKSMSAKVMIQKEVIPQVVSDVCSNGANLVTCITTLANKSTSSLTNIYHHDASLTNGANDNSYRFAGVSSAVNNYICLGSTESPCPDANLFRIIGVFGDQVKVIRAKSLGDMKWDDSDANENHGSNTWSTSSLNTYLNGEYLTSLGNLTDNIATTSWKVAGNIYTELMVNLPSVAYQNEIINPNENGTSTTGEIDYSAKVGLMYISDYLSAASPESWPLSTSYKYNWLYSSNVMWIATITRDSQNSLFLIPVSKDFFRDVVPSDEFPIFPVFYLKSSVTYVSGDGTQSSPIRIN